MSNLLIVGAGGHGHFVKETAATMQMFDEITFVEDIQSDYHVSLFYNYRSLLSKYTHAFPAYRNNVQRLEWIEKLKDQGFIVPVLKHSTAVVHETATVLEGSIIGAMTVVNANVCIEQGCIISLGAIIEHDALIKAGSFLDIGCRVKSNQVFGQMVVDEFSGVFDRERSFF